MGVLAPLLGEITRAFPRIEIKSTRGPPHQITEKLKSGEIKIAVAGPLGDDWERLDVRLLDRDDSGTGRSAPPVAMVRKDHRSGGFDADEACQCVT
jgi:DNA-binding transcriptional LysR family regulator